MAMIAPGMGAFSGTASLIKTFRDSHAQRLRPARSFLSYKKYRRRIFGMLKMK